MSLENSGLLKGKHISFVWGCVLLLMHWCAAWLKMGGECSISSIILGEACSPSSHSVGCNGRKVKIDHFKDNSSTTKENMVLKVMQGKNERSFFVVLLRRGCLFCGIEAFYLWSVIFSCLSLLRGMKETDSLRRQVIVPLVSRGRWQQEVEGGGRGRKRRKSGVPWILWLPQYCPYLGEEAALGLFCLIQTLRLLLEMWECKHFEIEDVDAREMCFEIVSTLFLLSSCFSCCQAYFWHFIESPPLSFQAPGL